MKEGLQIISVKYSSAQEIAKLLDEILQIKNTGKFRRSSLRNTSSSGISKIIAEPPNQYHYRHGQ